MYDTSERPNESHLRCLQPCLPSQNKLWSFIVIEHDPFHPVALAGVVKQLEVLERIFVLVSCLVILLRIISILPYKQFTVNYTGPKLRFCVFITISFVLSIGLHLGSASLGWCLIGSSSTFMIVLRELLLVKNSLNHNHFCQVSLRAQFWVRHCSCFTSDPSKSCKGPQ